MTADVTRPAKAGRGPRVVRAVSALVVVACVGLAVVVTLRMWPSDVAERRMTPPATLRDEDLERYRSIDAEAFADPIVLSFHDIAPLGESAPSPLTLTLTPERFDEHMAMLAAAGFTSITPEQLIGHLDGSSPLPSRTVLLTFDDGTQGVWVYADRILERYGFQATAFIISGSIGERQPYYLTWDEVRAMRDTGRWSFGAHTDAGHTRIQVEPDGEDDTPFLLARRWLASESRNETLAEWRARVEQDLDANIDRLIRMGLPRPVLFSYPFSAVTSPTNEASIPEELVQLLRSKFEAVLANDGGARPLAPGRATMPVGTSDAASGYLPRFLIVGETTSDVFDRLVAAAQADAAAADADG